MSTIVALLGPTNTGKTHRAIERMLEHRSGVIGLPLRLLAREIYDRVSARIGEQLVALVTGEEKRIPARPRYWVCTTESMPVDRDVDFVAIDEVQLAAHAQRGHVFTARLLHARGLQETWLMGADTMRGMVERLVPTADVWRHPRLSKLSARGPNTIGSLPPRSAVIAFSATEVYTIAERLRRRRGGAAVVLGALSPRTRNAQVAMYQAGEVDFLVATDAIGMGLNMDVDHIAFAALRKFDGTCMRNLTAAELAQIAGRAGRYTRDGTFGTLSPIELHPDTIFAIEGHRFAPVKRVMWRNSDLDTSSVASLLASLEERPRGHHLSMVGDADDEKVLRMLVEKEEVSAKASCPATVRLLWDVCRIPDFRKLLTEHHAALLAEIYLQLAGPKARIDPDYMHERISRLEDARGDIDTLLMRMEFIRTWNYIAHRGEWIRDAESWQLRTQRAEDRLSQALHEELIARFVETGRRRRRGGTSRKRGRQPRTPERVATTPQTASSPFAALSELRDKLRRDDDDDAPVTDAFVDALVEAPHGQFTTNADGSVWIHHDEDGLVQVATLTRGSDLLHPEVKLLSRELGPGGRARVLRRLRAFARDFVGDVMGPLRDERLATASAAGRGLIYQLEQQLGNVTTRRARAQLRELSDSDRALLAQLGIKVGRRFVYAERLVTRDAIERRSALCHAYAPFRALTSDADAASVRTTDDADLIEASGFSRLGPFAVRIDVVEQLDADLRQLAKTAPFDLPPAILAMLDCSADDAERIVTAMGYPHTAEGFVRKPRRRRRSRRRD